MIFVENVRMDGRRGRTTARRCNRRPIHLKYLHKRFFFRMSYIFSLISRIVTCCEYYFLLRARHARSSVYQRYVSRMNDTGHLCSILKRFRFWIEFQIDFILKVDLRLQQRTRRALRNRRYFRGEHLNIVAQNVTLQMAA